MRSQRRKLNTTEFRGPSKILGTSLIFSVTGIVITYIIWGFGSGSGSSSEYYQQGYYYYGNNRKVEEQHYAPRVPNVMRLKDYRERFWIPFETVVEDILLQDQNQNEYSKGDFDSTPIGRSLQENFWNNQDIAYNLRSLFCIVFFLILGIFGRRRRMKTRFAVLKARLQDDKVFFGPLSANRRRGRKMDREDKYDGACSHTLCGCYPVDKVEEEEAEALDCMNWGVAKLSNLFCGKCCRLWVQCFSVCALAQEAREVRLLVPPKDQRVDYITHQPFEEYFKDVHFLRRKWKSSGVLKQGEKRGWRSHLGALSRLSRYILTTFISVTAVIIITERFNPQAIFSWGDACVLIMTFVQSFIVLGECFVNLQIYLHPLFSFLIDNLLVCNFDIFTHSHQTFHDPIQSNPGVVHGLFHKSDLSLDAVIKFFGAGFIIATPMAFLVEIIVVNILMAIYYAIALVVAVLAGGGIGVWIYDDYKYFMAFADIVQAYLVAAASEEICKYYTFRSVEHPDLIFLTGLDRTTHDAKARIGGGEAYPYSSNNASSLECRTGTFESSFSRKSNKTKKNHRGVSPGGPIEKVQSFLSIRKRFNDDDTDIELDIRTVRQKAAAVTTAMISTAVGLACAENFIYVFFLSGSNTQEELAMLLLRSIFPVHALCAGIQSIGVIKKFLEEGEASNNVGVGKIVFPAIMLHGSFDSILMLINSYVDIVSDMDDDGNNVYDPALVNTVAACSVIGVMIIGFIWYWRQNRLQKARLKGFELLLLAQVGQLPAASAPKKNKNGASGRKSREEGELELL